MTNEHGRCPVCDTDEKPDGDTCRECGFNGRCHECGAETFADYGDPNYCSAYCRIFAAAQRQADIYL
jgi:hypothetical protein